MVEMKLSPVEPRMVWTGAELGGRAEWQDWISPEEMDELRRAAATLPPDPAQWPRLTRDDLPLPSLGMRIVRMADELENGRGFVLIRGLDVSGPEDDIRRWYWALGTHFGRMVTQSPRGDLIGEVTDRGGRYGADPHARGYTSNAEMRFHSDVADVVSLLCVRPARTGGESSIVSTMTIYDRILEEAPHILPALYRGFRYYVRLAETADGGEQGMIAPYRDAMYVYAHGRLSGGINPQSIRSLTQVTGEPLPADEEEALNLVEQIAERPGLALTLKLEVGDLLLVNNLMVLHKRTAFEDHEAPDRRRLLLRLWLNLHNGRVLPQDCAKQIQRDGFGRPKLDDSPRPARA